MADIIINTTNLKVYETLFDLCILFNRPEKDAEYLWNTLLENNEFMYEFIYYLEHSSLLDNMTVHNYTLSDIYVYQIGHYNLFISDVGKNYASCNKDAIVFDTFITMADLINKPELTIKKLTGELGNDIQ